MSDENAGTTADPESLSTHDRLPHWRLIIDQGITTHEIEKWNYEGSGTEEDPYAVAWIENDPRNPMTWEPWYKWMITLCMAFSTLAVSLCSSAVSGAIPGLLIQYGAGREVGTLAISLFVVGFAIGPLIWAPLSELYGRQVLFFGTFACFAFFNAGVAGAQNMWSVIILRFFAGAFGSSPLTNAGGVVADCFPARQRGMAMGIFAAAPFLGPALGPVIGGFMGENAGWRWVMGFLAAFSGFCWILGTVATPETYAPVLLRRRAKRLSKMTGKVYRSKLDVDRGEVSIAEAFKTSLSRPWILLFREPIVSALSVYMAIIYGTLYMLFAAYPIVYVEHRGWSIGIGGLPFLAVLIGMNMALVYYIFVENRAYKRKVDEAKGALLPPEARLPAAMVGGLALPIGLFWFSWTNSPSLPWAASVAAGIPFGFGMVLSFLGIMNYLIDAYTIFAASVLAASSVLRSLFGAAFPLFTTYMYNNLGIHWASSIPAFLALACVPFPFLFYKYGPAIRTRCHFAAEADAFMKRLLGHDRAEAPESTENLETEAEEEGEIEKEDMEKEVRRPSAAHTRESGLEPAEEVEAEAFEEAFAPEEPRFERIKTGHREEESVEYDDNPYVIDRLNTRESFSSSRVRATSVSSQRSKISLARRQTRDSRK